MKKRFLILVPFLVAGFVSAAEFRLARLAAPPPKKDAREVTYEKDIKPILDASCIKCHGAVKPKNGLRLDTLAGTLAGSKGGKVVKPGNAGGSQLYRAVTRMDKNDEKWMPPPNNKAKIAPLKPDEVALIRAWIDQGAK